MTGADLSHFSPGETATIGATEVIPATGALAVDAPDLPTTAAADPVARTATSTLTLPAEATVTASGKTGTRVESVGGATGVRGNGTGIAGLGIGGRMTTGVAIVAGSGTCLRTVARGAVDVKGSLRGRGSGGEVRRHPRRSANQPPTSPTSFRFSTGSGA